MKILFISIAMLAALAGHSQPSITIYFDFNRYAIREKGMAQMDSFLIAQAKAPAEIVLSLDGYCDPAGPDHYNNLLSMNRVLAARNYLLLYGIKAENMEDISGHGEKDPLNMNRTPEERQLNRRVTISIVNAKTGDKTLTEKIADSTVTVGSNIILRNINFVGGRRHPLPESKPALDELLAAMNTFPKLVIQIEGNICCQEGDADGFDIDTGIKNLSEERAKRIADWLLHMGIDSNRVSYKGLGHSQPLYPYPEKTEEERKQNRRVEIKIISK